MDALRYVTAQIDEGVVNPIASRLTNSVANPYVLSYLLWEQIKKLTPQRARDLTRLLSTAITNALGVLSGAHGKALVGTAKRLQDEMLAAVVTPQGKDVMLNAVATASKVAQALNTPETRLATQQVFETAQSVIDLLASDAGRKVVGTVGECVTNMFAVAASPEASIFLAEVATNICHAFETEALRREEAKANASADPAADGDGAQQATEQVDAMTGKALHSPVASSVDTSFETESNTSDASPPSSSPYVRVLEPMLERRSVPPAAVPAAVVPNRRERSASRSARIERDVLLKMGVDPSMVSEIQRVLDTIQAEEAQQAADEALRAQQNHDAAMVDTSDDEGTGLFSFAFGEQTEAFPMEEESKQEDAADGVLTPEWHSDLVRDAVRRRHAASEQRMTQRNRPHDQAREMVDVLSRRRIQHGDLKPSDVMACRAISQLITFCLAFLILLLLFSVTRRVLGI